MDVVHALPPIGSAVDDCPIAAFETKVRSDFSDDTKQVSHQPGIAVFEIVQRSDLFFRDDENVRRSLTIDIAESQCLVVLVDDVGGDFPVDNLREDRRH